MQLEVTISLPGGDLTVGTLFTHARRGVETASFSYSREYLADSRAFPLAPDMPLAATSLHAQGMFSAFSDAMPDRWGRNLLRRSEARRAGTEQRTPRTLLEADYLAGVADIARQGALRFWLDGKPVAPMESGVPRIIRIPHLLGESFALEEDAAADVRDLLEAGSSLGGARPKASVVDEAGKLMVAKLPKKEESLIEDTCAWECAALAMAGDAGIAVPRTRLMRVEGRAVLLLERFDRNGIQRVPYLSGLTAVQGKDGGSCSYLELVEFLERYGSCPGVDIPQLWLRILYSCLIGNVDDHMRNHGFLWDGTGWRLAPAFDINPTEGCGAKFLSCAIDLDEAEASVDVAMRAADYYRVGKDQAAEGLARTRKAIGRWEKVARSCGISAASIKHMSSCFEAALA